MFQEWCTPLLEVGTCRITSFMNKKFLWKNRSQYKCYERGMRKNKVRIRPQRWSERDKSYLVLFV